MSWWSDTVRGRARDSVLVPLLEASDVELRVVEPESSYVSIFLRSLRVVDVRRGLSQFYGAVTSCCSIPHRRGERAEFFAVTMPAALRDVSPKFAHRMLTLNTRILGPVPYRGGDVELQLGLLSVKSSDLAGPYLELLETLAAAAGVSFVGSAVAIGQPIRKGLELLLGTDDPSILEVGLALTLSQPATGVFALLGAPSPVASTLRLDASSGLCLENGQPVTDLPYLVFSIEAHAKRDDWFNVPGLRDAHQELVREVQKGDVRGTDAALAVFRRTAVLSDDLLAADGVRLYEKVRDEVGLALRARPTARAETQLRAIEEVDLYP